MSASEILWCGKGFPCKVRFGNWLQPSASSASVPSWYWKSSTVCLSKERCQSVGLTVISLLPKTVRPHRKMTLSRRQILSFDRLFANAGDGSGLSEPTEAAGTGAPDVDNQVRRKELTSEPSPFAFEEPAIEATASAESEKESAEPNRITPVAFQENESAPGVAPSNEAGSSGADPDGTPTMSFGASEPTANPFPQEEPLNSAAAANPPESSSASTPSASTPAAGTSTTDDSIMFFPGQSETPDNTGSSSPAAAPKTAEGTKSAFPADGENSSTPGPANPAAEPTVSAQTGDGEIPAFDFGSSPEPPAAGTPSANPFSPSPFSDDEKPAPTDEQPTPAFPAFDEAPPGSGLPEPVPANPRRDPRNPLDVEPQPFERDQDSPIERELESTQPGRSTRPARPEAGAGFGTARSETMRLPLMFAIGIWNLVRKELRPLPMRLLMEVLCPLFRTKMVWTPIHEHLTAIRRGDSQFWKIHRVVPGQVTPEQVVPDLGVPVKVTRIREQIFLRFRELKSRPS